MLTEQVLGGIYSAHPVTEADHTQVDRGVFSAKNGLAHF